MSRKTFSAEFKQECVELVVRQGYQVKQAALAMNIGFSTLQRWIRQYREEQQGLTPTASAITPEQQRIQALEKQVKQLQSDNDLLKKASVDSSYHRNTLFNHV